MAHEPTYEITSAVPQRRFHGPVGHIQHPQMLSAEIPPGVGWVILPNGVRTLAYTQPNTPPPAAAPVSQPVPAWAKTTALLAPTLGAGVAAAGIGLSYAAPGLIAMSQALWSTAALLVAAVIAVPLLLRGARKAAGGSRSSTHITQNITATGLFGRANGTINNR